MCRLEINESSVLVESSWMLWLRKVDDTFCLDKIWYNEKRRKLVRDNIEKRFQKIEPRKPE